MYRRSFSTTRNLKISPARLGSYAALSFGASNIGVIFGTFNYIFLLGLGSTVSIILTSRYGFVVEGGGPILGAPNIAGLENINALLNTLHDTIISSHNALTDIHNLIMDPTAITFQDSRSLHDGLCQILASIVNISPGLEGPLQVLYNIDIANRSPEILELIDSFETHVRDFELLVREFRQLIAYIEFNSNCSFFLSNNGLFGFL